MSIAVLICRIVIIGTYSKSSVQVIISAFVRALILIVHRTDMDDKVFGREQGKEKVKEVIFSYRTTVYMTVCLMCSLRDGLPDNAVGS